MIAIVDYDAGNIKSVEKALIHLGEKPIVTRDHEVIDKADALIVPGVGSFGDAMANINKYNLKEKIREVAASSKPILGICLGLQIFFEESEENEGVEGLALLPGKVKKFPIDLVDKIPHMGWNSINKAKESRLLEGIEENSYVYFVHSYYLEAKNKSDVLATAEYGLRFDAAVERDNIFATQFHPEKSSDIGLKILKNFIEIAK